MSTSFAVKSVFQEDLRRFKLERASFESLRQALLSTYPQLTDEFTVKYTDDEGDQCLITSDMELAEAAHVAEQQQSPLKVTVFATKVKEIQEASPVKEKKFGLAMKFQNPHHLPRLKTLPIPSSKLASKHLQFRLFPRKSLEAKRRKRRKKSPKSLLNLLKSLTLPSQPCKTIKFKQSFLEP